MATPSIVVYLNKRQLEFHLITILTPHTFCYFVFGTVLFCCLWWVVVLWFLFLCVYLLHHHLQCFISHLSSIQTCLNGIRGRWQIWVPVSVLSLPLCGHAFRCCVFKYTTTRVFHLITILTRSGFFWFLERYFFVLFFLFLCWTPSSAVFEEAYVFNQDVSKWNTGAVTTMSNSKCLF